MLIVDSHVHVGLTAYRPVEALLEVLDRHAVQKAVLVQYGGNFDNTYLAECARRFPGRFATVGSVDTTQPGAAEDLERWVRDFGLGGIRLPATARTLGPEPLAIWAAIESLGIVASVTGNLEQMTSPDMEAVIQRFPALRLRLEHLGWFPDAAEPPPYPRFQKLLRLAQYPNVYMMYSAFFGWSRQSYPYEDTLPFIRLAYEAYGARRIMWGSDWPPVEDHEGYQQALDFIPQVLAFVPPADLDWIMGGTAATLWQL